MKFQNTLPDDKVQCTLCPRRCILANGQSGFCYVRKNVDGTMTLTSYGFNTGLAVDPIEKKPLYHFLPGSKVLSFGTLGCNLGCRFCQNWRTTKVKGDIEKLNKTMPSEIAEIAIENGCKSVAFTYNDPVIFFEYAVDTAIECHKVGLKTVAVTAGYINEEPRREFFKHMDAANIDLKGFSEEFYKKNCLASLQPVLDTIKYVKNNTQCHLELTTLLIEGENDSEEELRAECEWIVKELGDDVPLHFSAFHPDYKFYSKSATTINSLLRAYNIAKEAGIKYVYLGNIHDTYTATTYCHHCSKPIIQRDGLRFLNMSLNVDEQGGHCAFCGTKCDGVFEKG